VANGHPLLEGVGGRFPNKFVSNATNHTVYPEDPRENPYTTDRTTLDRVYISIHNTSSSGSALGQLNPIHHPVSETSPV